MNIAIDMPQQLHKATTLKEIFAKIFSFHKDITSVLVCDPNQSKKIYKKLLKNIIDEVHKKIAKSEKRGSEHPNVHFTKDQKRIHFSFEDPIIQNTLMKYEFLKSGNTLDATRVKQRITSMHQNDLHHKIARLSMIKFNEDARPYLDIDDTGIVLKKDMQLGNHEYMEVPAGWNSFR